MRFVRTAENLFGLPLGFTRVEYLQSTGTQYIDMGIKSGINISVKTKFNLADVSAKAMFGSYSGPSNNGVGVFFGTAGGNLSGKVYCNNTNVAVSPDLVLSTNTDYETEMSGTSLILNNSEYTTATTADNNYNMLLFARNNNGTVERNMSGKIYYLTIKDNDVLVRDFIPCIDPLGVPCMYDLVGKKPYYNIGTGTFTAGRKVIPVEYIESTGTQYIDTGVGGDLTTELTCEAAIVQAGNASVTNIMGNNVTSTRAITINMSANITNPSPSRIRFGNTDNTTEAGAINLNTFYKYDTNKNELTVKDSSGTVLNTYPLNATTAFTTNGNILIYKLGDTSTQYIGNIKVKGATIKNSGVLVRDFIPCKDENNVGFMFDKVSGTCYLNAGTGAFSVGENKYTSKLRLIKEAKELPDGYKRVEYLESDSTAYIDTGVSGANNNLKIEMGFSYSKFTAYGYFFSNYESETANVTRFCLNGTDTSWGLAYINTKSQYGAIYTSNFTKNNFHTFVLTKTSVSIDGNTTTNNNPPVGTANTKNIILFNRGSGSYAEKRDIGMRCYYFRIYDNDVLVRDFIPVLDNAGIPALYDKVNGGIYYNQGTGDFTYGHTITPVEYLESTGTQYINTGIKLDNNSSVELYYQLTQAVQNRKGLFGGLDTGGSKRFGTLLSPSNNQLECGYGSGNEYYQLGLPDTNIHVIKQEKNLLYFDGSLVYTFNTATFTQSFNAPLGNFNYTNYNPASAKYYRSKWWDNGTLVRSFIPVRDENNVGYMFDEVTGQLFGNAGSGSFGIGNDLPTAKVRFIQDVIPSAYLPLKYLESTGTQFILTGFTPTVNTDFELELSSTKTSTNWAIGCPTWVGVHYKGADGQIGVTNSSTSDFQQYVNYARDNTRITMKLSGDTVYANGVSLGTITRRAGTLDFALFGYRDANRGATLLFTGSIYKCIIWENGVPVMDLYPALRKSDNKPGMYDRITKQFFTNDATSGNDFNYE